MNLEWIRQKKIRLSDIRNKENLKKFCKKKIISEFWKIKQNQYSDYDVYYY